MDIFTYLSETTNYTMPQLQGIIAAWVATGAFEGRSKVQTDNGHVNEEDYTKQSVYSLLYSLYRQVGTVKDEHGTPYEFTFNTWGYAWPKAWGPAPFPESEPQRFGKNAYTGLYHFDAIQKVRQIAFGFRHRQRAGRECNAGQCIQTHRTAVLVIIQTVLFYQ